MARRNRFVDLLRSRGIEELLHFTQVSNLQSIIDNDLLPISILDQEEIPYAFSDPDRRENEPDAISLSVTYFNWKMFDAVRQRHPSAEWVVLAIDADILVGADCLFYPTNAACGGFRRSNRNYASINAFEAMFEDRRPNGEIRETSWRDEAGLAHNMTSDPQAEVLFKGGIELTDIRGAWLENAEVGEDLRHFFKEELKHEIDVMVEPLRPRHIYRGSSWG